MFGIKLPKIKLPKAKSLLKGLSKGASFLPIPGANYISTALNVASGYIPSKKKKSAKTNAVEAKKLSIFQRIINFFKGVK
jgi:hypothetical protein